MGYHQLFFFSVSIVEKLEKATIDTPKYKIITLNFFVLKIFKKSTNLKHLNKIYYNFVS